MQSEEFIFVQNIKSEINSIIAQKKNQIKHKVQALTKIKFDLVEEEINFMCSTKSREKIIYHDTDRQKIEGDLEMLKHSIFILDNELRTLFFIRNTFSEKTKKEEPKVKGVI